MIDIYDCGMNGKLHKITLGSYGFWISYDTIVAFNTPEEGLVICENVWSMTTGKHLNYINGDKKVRLPSNEFDDKLRAVTDLLEEKLKYSKVIRMEMVKNEC